MRHAIRHKSMIAAAAIGASAVLLVGCGTREFGDTRAQAVGNAAAPMAVSCEPNQRALVRPVVINGATVSQVECVSGQYAAAPAPVPVAYQPAVPAAVPVNYAVPAQQQFVPLENTRVVPVQPYPAAAPAAPRRAVYQRAPERVLRSQRSVKKSAVIIGSSAAGGAGLGALLGGKKGAAIGAVVGGGGATLWDQITRHNNK
jgi:hypothetical protein